MRRSVTLPLRISGPNRIDEPRMADARGTVRKIPIVVPTFTSDGPRVSSSKHYGRVEPIGYIPPVKAEANDDRQIAEPARFTGST